MSKGFLFFCASVSLSVSLCKVSSYVKRYHKLLLSNLCRACSNRKSRNVWGRGCTVASQLWGRGLSVSISSFQFALDRDFSWSSAVDVLEAKWTWMLQIIWFQQLKENPKRFFFILSFLPAFLLLVFQPLMYLQTGFTMGARQPSGLDYWSLS